MKDFINIYEELKQLNSPLAQVGNLNLQEVPPGYFDDLASVIKARVYVESIKKEKVQYVPEGYFENFSTELLSKIHEKPFSINGKMPFTVPDSYFEDLSQQILSRVKGMEANEVSRELQELSPLLYSIPKTNIFSVPENYFKDFTVTNPAGKVDAAKPQAKIISLSTRFRKGVAYAAAACILFVLGSTGFWYFNNDNSSAPYKALSNINIQAEIKNLSDKQIESLIDEQNNSAIYINAGFNNNDADVKRLLDNTTNEEIESYLNDNADPGENI